MELVLTYYCKVRGVAYKQGLGHLLAPLLVLFRGTTQHEIPQDGSGASEEKERDSRESLGSVSNCFTALVDRYLPSVFKDREVGCELSQCAFSRKIV